MRLQLKWFEVQYILAASGDRSKNYANGQCTTCTLCSIRSTLLVSANSVQQIAVSSPFGLPLVDYCIYNNKFYFI